MPVGFMAQAVHGQLQIVFCTAGYPQLKTLTHAEHADAGVATHTNAADQHQHDFSCPFGHAVAAPLLDLSGSEVIAYLPQAESLPPTDAPYYAIGPPRVVLTRGPPANA